MHLGFIFSIAWTYYEVINARLYLPEEIVVLQAWKRDLYRWFTSFSAILLLATCVMAGFNVKWIYEF